MRDAPEHADADAMLQHVLKLGRKHQIRIIMDTELMRSRQGDPTKPYGAAYRNVAHDGNHCLVHIPLVNSPRTYAVALHELGHVIHPHGWIAEHTNQSPLDLPTARNLGLLLEEENAAWQWAEQNALVWSAEMREVRKWAQSTYAEYVRIMHGLVSMNDRIVNPW